MPYIDNPIYRRLYDGGALDSQLSDSQYIRTVTGLSKAEGKQQEHRIYDR